MLRRTSPAALVLPAAATLILAGCWGGDSDSGSLVDTYSPKYTEAKGTVHAGDFFPLEPGDIYGVTGTTTGTVRVSMKVTAPEGSFSQDTTMAMNETDIGTVETRPSVSRAFVAGTFTVFPQISTMVTTDADDFETEESSANFFEKTAAAINLRGVEDADGLVTEPENPLFLKLPLTVGDNWEGASESVPMTTEEGSTLDMNMRSRMFVVGMESVTLGGRAYQALRLDQVVAVTASGVEEGVTTTVNGEFTVNIYLVDGVGQVGQRMKGKMSASGSASEEGASMKMSMSMDMQGEMARSENVPVLAKIPAPVRGGEVAVPGQMAFATPSQRVPAALSLEAKVAASAQAAALGAARKLWRTSMR